MNRVTCLVAVLVLMALCGLATSALPSSTPPYPPAAGDVDNTTTTPLTRYDTVPVYLHLKNNYTQHEWMATYWVRVDEFSLLEVAYSDIEYFIYNPNMTIWMEFRGMITPTKTIFSGPLQAMVTFFTLIIQLNAGDLTSPVWDDGCTTCSPSTCVQNVCGLAKSDLASVCSGGGVDCSIKTYIGWAGTDATNSQCVSSSSVPSRFEQFSLTPLTNLGTSLWNDAIFNVESSNPPPTQY
jgi:hypothetical protein